MKVYVTARYKGADNKQEIEALCKAVKDAHLQVFSFIRDVENYKQTFDDPKELWDRARDEIRACDALLIDVSDGPTGGRMVEAGIAFAMRKPVIVTKKTGVKHKGLFDGIASTVIEYKDYSDLSKQLEKYDADRNFNTNDRLTILVMLLLGGAVIGGLAASIFLPLAFVASVAYWLILRAFFSSVRIYDRIVIYIPIAFVWGVGFLYLNGIGTLYALAWTIGYWIVAVFVLAKMKLSL